MTREPARCLRYAVRFVAPLRFAPPFASLSPLRGVVIRSGEGCRENRRNHDGTSHNLSYNRSLPIPFAFLSSRSCSCPPLSTFPPDASRTSKTRECEARRNGNDKSGYEVMGSVRGSFLRSFPCPSTRPTRGRSVHRHSGSSSLTFLVTSFLFTSLSSRPFGAHFIRPGTGPSLASLASLVRDVPSLGLRPSLPSVGRDKC